MHFSEQSKQRAFDLVYNIKNELWKTRFFELNYSDSYYIKFIQKNLIDNVITQKSIDKVIFFGPNKFNFNDDIILETEIISQFFLFLKFFRYVQYFCQ